MAEPTLTALHYLFDHAGDRVVAHCLELDLVTSGANLEDAEASLDAVVRMQFAACFKSGNLRQLLLEAPADYWASLRTGRQIGRKDLDVEVPPVILPVNRSVANVPVYRFERELVAA